MSELNIRERQAGDVTVLDMEGRITIGEGSVALRSAIRRLLEEGKKKILLNLAKVGYIDSSGIGELVSSYTAINKEGGQLKLLSLTQKLQDLSQVPGDGLPFPVRVGSKDDLLVFLGRGPQLVDRLASAFHDLVVRLEAVVHLDPHLLFRQVADVAHRGPDIETVTQKPLQCPGLGRRLDDDQSFWHSFSLFPKPGLLFPSRGLRRASYARSLPRRNALTYPP